jgi:hypothetical protein
MDELLALFRLGMSPLELFVRGTAVYWFLFLLFRFVLRRDAGAIGIADILLLVLIADASQNAMAGGYETVADGFLLVATAAAPSAASPRRRRSCWCAAATSNGATCDANT